MSEPKWWRHTFDKIDEPIEKFQYLVGLSGLSWDDCCDAWYESVKLMPEISSYAEKLREENERLKEYFDSPNQDSLRRQSKRIDRLEAALRFVVESGSEFWVDQEGTPMNRMSKVVLEALKGGDE